MTRTSSSCARAAASGVPCTPRPRSRRSWERATASSPSGRSWTPSPRSSTSLSPTSPPSCSRRCADWSATCSSHPSGPPPRHPDVVVRLLSYNVKGLQLDRQALVQVIRAAAPDVLLLQEAPRGPLGGRRTRGLAREVGLVAVVAHRRGRGAAIAVRPELLPHVLDARGVVLESRLARFRRGWPTPRGYAVVRLASPHGGEPTTIVSVHMSAIPAQRARHLPAYRALVAR